jgi:hypothetical protein
MRPTFCFFSASGGVEAGAAGRVDGTLPSAAVPAQQQAGMQGKQFSTRHTATQQNDYQLKPTNTLR